MVVFVRYIFAVWELSGIVGKQPRKMTGVCLHDPAQSAFWHSTTAEMCKGNTFYLSWLSKAAAIWRMGTPFGSWCILNGQVSARLPASFLVQKGASHSLPRSLLWMTTRCVVPPLQINATTFTFPWIRHPRRTSCWKESCFPSISSAEQTLPILCHVVQQFVFWTNLPNRLVRYILIRVPEISAQTVCIEIKIPSGLHCNRNISYLLNHIFKYPCVNETVGIKHCIR